MTDCPAHFAQEAPTIDKADALVRQAGVEAAKSEDANDVVYLLSLDTIPRPKK